jgi:diguanylate cyclase (GGDEF)-like protein
MTLPIMSRGSVLGLLVFYTQENENPLGEEQFKTVETFSDYLSIAVENASNFQKVRELTVTDDLTKLYNSRYLHLVLERELARSERYQEQFSLVFIDLDNFKKINDSSGHMAGSLILKEFGDFLVRAIRISDIAIRYGGDEFVLVLPNTSKNEAVQFVTRARETLNQSVFLKSRGLSIKCTASFGISSFPEDGRSVDQLISAADKAMYMVKRGSKDGIQAYTQPATMIKGDRLPS